MRKLPSNLVDKKFRKLSRKRTFFLRTVNTEPVTLPPQGWSGGSIETYDVVDLETMCTPKKLGKVIPPKGWPHFQAGSYELPHGQAVILGGIFRGSTKHLTIVVNQCDLAHVIEAFNDDTPSPIVEDWLIEAGVE